VTLPLGLESDISPFVALSRVSTIVCLYRGEGWVECDFLFFWWIDVSCGVARVLHPTCFQDLGSSLAAGYVQEVPGISSFRENTVSVLSLAKF
jgi:hypothetical protein